MPLDEAAEQIRREESDRLPSEGDDILKRTRCLWLHGRATEEHMRRFVSVINGGDPACNRASREVRRPAYPVTP